MPVFTAIAVFIVETAIIYSGAIVAAGTIAFATSVIAAGLAIVTARLIMGSQNQGSSVEGATQSQGTRVQLPPASENKIPVIYGRAFQQGIITDAHISNENKTMTYVMVLSEKCPTASYTINNIFWNDQTLNFGADGYTVESSTQADGSNNSNYNGLIRMWAWAGGQASGFQIFGPSPTVDAQDIIPEVGAGYFMSGLVFAVVQIDYNSEKGVTNLQNVTFDITSSLSSPGDVWYDYMTNDIYGAGIPGADIDTASVAAINATSSEIPPNQFQTDGTTPSTQPRYVINGVLNTVDTIKANLDRINVASATWTTYDHKLGKWRLIANRELTGGELSATRLYDDDTITGEISITSTNLEDMYNHLEVAYANRGLRDQTDYYKADIAAEFLNDLEPYNLLRMNTVFCNNAIHAARVGLIELKQSRSDLVITFQTDYSGLQTEAGDVIKVTNTIYGFDEKLFRVTRVRETEGVDGGLTAEITGIQYNAEVYTDETLTDGQNKPLSDIPAIGTTTLLSPSIPSVVAITTGTSASFTLRTTINGDSGPVDNVQFWYSNTSTGGFVNLITVYGMDGSNFNANENVQGRITTLPAATYYFQARVGLAGLFSPLSSTSSVFVWNPAFDYGPIVP